MIRLLHVLLALLLISSPLMSPASSMAIAREPTPDECREAVRVLWGQSDSISENEAIRRVHRDALWQEPCRGDAVVEALLAYIDRLPRGEDGKLSLSNSYDTGRAIEALGLAGAGTESRRALEALDRLRRDSGYDDDAITGLGYLASPESVRLLAAGLDEALDRERGSRFKNVSGDYVSALGEALRRAERSPEARDLAAQALAAAVLATEEVGFFEFRSSTGRVSTNTHFRTEAVRALTPWEPGVARANPNRPGKDVPSWGEPDPAWQRLRVPATNVIEILLHELSWLEEQDTIGEAETMHAEAVADAMLGYLIGIQDDRLRRRAIDALISGRSIPDSFWVDRLDSSAFSRDYLASSRVENSGLATLLRDPAARRYLIGFGWHPDLNVDFAGRPEEIELDGFTERLTELPADLSVPAVLEVLRQIPERGGTASTAVVDRLFDHLIERRAFEQLKRYEVMAGMPNAASRRIVDRIWEARRRAELNEGVMQRRYATMDRIPLPGFMNFDGGRRFELSAFEFPPMPSREEPPKKYRVVMMHSAAFPEILVNAHSRGTIERFASIAKRYRDVESWHVGIVFGESDALPDSADRLLSLILEPSAAGLDAGDAINYSGAMKAMFELESTGPLVLSDPRAVNLTLGYTSKSHQLYLHDTDRGLTAPHFGVIDDENEVVFTPTTPGLGGIVELEQWLDEHAGRTWSINLCSADQIADAAQIDLDVALRIVAERVRNGRFRTPDQLSSRLGFGPSDAELVTKLRNALHFD